jgi:hypothetical protein
LLLFLCLLLFSIELLLFEPYRLKVITLIKVNNASL